MASIIRYESTSEDLIWWYSEVAEKGRSRRILEAADGGSWHEVETVPCVADVPL